MAPLNLTIPNTALGVGTHEFGPAPLDDTVSVATITIDRTTTKGATNGLNLQPATTKIEIGVWQSNDGGVNWLFRASAGLIGGIYAKNIAGDPYLESNVQVELLPGTGRQAKAVVEVAGASVAVAGSLVVV